MNPRVIPTLLLKGDGLVKTVKFNKFNYIGDPINAVRLFNDMEVDELVFLDISTDRFERGINFPILKKIASECFMPLAYGGGIKSIEEIKMLIQLGFEKVIINSYAIKTPDIISDASELLGSQSVVVSIDVKKTIWNKQYVFINGGKENTKLSPVSHAIEMEKRGAGELLLTSINSEGTMRGYDINLINSVANNVNIPVVASGGAGEINDFKKAVQANASAVAAGSLFVYHSKIKGVLINYPSQIELSKIFE
jgi:cyclase